MAPSGACLGFPREFAGSRVGDKVVNIDKRSSIVCEPLNLCYGSWTSPLIVASLGAQRSAAALNKKSGET